MVIGNLFIKIPPMIKMINLFGNGNGKSAFSILIRNPFAEPPLFVRMEMIF